jgi:DNA-binding ferritin-like protein
MDKCCKTAILYMATLKAMGIIHQNSHWTTKGETFYGDHLLFERLYKSSLEDLDSAAEKFMVLFVNECFNFAIHTEFLNKVLQKYIKLSGTPVSASLSIEKDFIKLSQEAYKCFEEEGKLTLGLDDMLCAISSNREGSVYLLQQVLKR